MWTRRELKERGKAAFKRNYWKAVLAALLFAIISGGVGASASSSSSSLRTEFKNGFENGTKKDSAFDSQYDSDSGVFDSDEFMKEFAGNDEDLSRIMDEVGKVLRNPANLAGIAVAGVAIFVVFIIVLALAVVVAILVKNPLEIGIRRFFTCNLNQEASLKEVAFAYKNNFKNNIKTMFFRDLFVSLWSLLFVIPGIIKRYEYRMIPYLLAENPSMTMEEAFAASKQMMDGQKWNAFVLDLSFIGWDILGGLTCGILSVFYVNPYIYSTEAALYETLRYGNTMNVEVNGWNTQF